MKWWKKQSLYVQNMIMSLVLVICCSIIMLVLFWEFFSSMEEAITEKLVLQILLSFLLVLFIAERLTVKMIAPIKQLLVKTQLLSEAKGIIVDKSVAAEVAQMNIVFDGLLRQLEAIHAEKSIIVTDVRRKKKMRDRLIRKLITIQEDERKRISRELHDEVGQALTALMVSMRALADGAKDERQRDILIGARDLAATTLNDIRILAVDLRPPVLDDLGLIPAIKKYIGRFRELHHISVEFTAKGGEGVISGYTAMALYRIIQESLTNVIRHAGATEVWITVEIRDKHVYLHIGDNGTGFLAETIYERRRENRLGVYGMMERVQLLGGTFKIDSQPGQGTKITVIVPNVGGEEANGTKD